MGDATILHLSSPQYLLLVLLSLVLPLSIFVGRRFVRVRRLAILQSLAVALSDERDLDAKGGIPPQLAIIKARYDTAVEHEPPRRKVLAWCREILIYTLPTLVFVLLSACGFALVLGLGREWLDATKILLNGLQAEGGSAVAFAHATALVIGAAFVGAYIWSIEYLILRIANFDLSPLSFLRTSSHILMTVLVAWVLRQIVAAPGLGEGMAVAVLLGIAFLSGLYPSLGINILVDRLPGWLRIKREVTEAKDIGRSFPLDLIDGVDYSIKFRLKQLEIDDAQHLATVNPVVLYVEAPYGLMEILDWIAQAQLLAELGPRGYLQARKAGIRDMATFLGLGRSEEGRALLAPLLFPDMADPSTASDATVHVRFESVANKLHVRSFEHWWTVASNATRTRVPAKPQPTLLLLPEQKAGASPL